VLQQLPICLALAAATPSSYGRHAWVGGDRRLADPRSRVALADQVATVVSVASWIGVLSLDLRFQLVTPEPENTILILRYEDVVQVVVFFFLAPNLVSLGRQVGAQRGGVGNGL
jgi:hypothetical protein